MFKIGRAGKTIFISKNSRFFAGFTLIELLVYIGIFATVAAMLTGVLVNVLRVQEREGASLEVAKQSQFVMRRIQLLIRESSVVESVYEGQNPAAPCTNFCSIKLRMQNSNVDPTIISSDANGIYLKEGAANPVPLTTDRVKVTNLIFARYQNPGGYTAVNIDLALVYNSDNPALQIAKQLISAVSRASAATFDSDLLPDAANLRNIGQSSLQWKDLNLSGNAYIGGNLTVSGTKSFVENHPADSSKNIVYVSLEGPEVGTYIRGTAACRRGEAIVVFPDYFRLVTHSNGLTAQLTPRSRSINLFIKELDNNRLVVGCGVDGEFDYWVNGIRRGYENYKAIQEKK